MLKTSLFFVAALAVAIASATVMSQDALAQDAQKGVQQEETTPLLTVPLAGVEGKEVSIVHISAPPGFVTPKHVHPGQLFIYVVQGSVTIDVEGEAPIKLGPGDVLQEPSGKAMVGKNPSSTQGAELVVFQIGDKGAPLMVTEE